MKHILSNMRFAVLAFVLVSQQAMASKIVVTIPPLAAAIKPLLSKEDQVVVLLARGQSPHGFYLKPSNLMAMQRADIIVSVGSGVDEWAQKAIQNLKNERQVFTINMASLPGMLLLQGKDDDDEHEGGHHEVSAEANHLSINPHIWLDMGNIQKLVSAFSDALIQQNPARAEAIRQKTKDWLTQLQATDNQIKTQLQPVKAVPYMVFHNAFAYYEKRYGLNNQGALHDSAEKKAGVKRLISVDELIQKHDIKCIFQEPQLSNKQLKVLVKGSQVKLGTLDPLGDGELNTQQFMEHLTQQYLDCLR